ncbi:MAG TPA: A24 family peptidase [Roseiarcus sp.]|nr:A24 family peptidase [Roseiarcus sp.]
MIEARSDTDVEMLAGAASLRPNVFVFLLGSVVAALLSFGFLAAPAAIASTLLGALMIAGADIDARTLLLPDLVTYGAIICGLVAAACLSAEGPWSGGLAAALGAAGTALALFCLRRIYMRLRGREGLGLGDVKLAGAIGAWLPADFIPICFALAAAAAIAVVLARRRTESINDMKVPFGAFLCPALWLAYFASALRG